MIQNVLKRSGLPSANSNTFLSYLKKIQTAKTIVLFLDYDGTLTPIVERPDQAFLSSDARQAIRCLSEHYKIAIVSGRTKRDVKSRVDIPYLFYAGSHGFDISGPIKTDEPLKITSKATEQPISQLVKENIEWKLETDTELDQPFITFQVANNYVPIMDQMFEKLNQELGNIKGCILENNIFSLSVHYRLIESELMVSKIEEVIQSLVEGQKGMVKVTHGKKVFEIRINLDWHKGKAIMKLLEYWDLTLPDKVFAIFVGDDKTDEDGFQYLTDHSLGVGILVSPQCEERPQIGTTETTNMQDVQIIHPSSNNLINKSESLLSTTTFAKYSLKDPYDVLIFLDKLSKLPESNL